WIEAIPYTRNVNKLKRVLKSPLMYGANETAELEDITLPRYIRITDFNNNGILQDDTFKSLPLEKADGYYLKDGDILFARSGATVGKTFQFKNYNGRACFAGYLIKASVNSYKILSDYLYYYTQSPAYDNWKNIIFTQATIQNISATKYDYLEISYPSIDEQKIIVKFLDKTCDSIDKAVELKQKQIEKLDDLRKSIIHNAVTKGLDASVEMKDSGIEWLGKIPKHWEVVKLKRFLISPLMYGANEIAEFDDVDLPRYLRITDFDENGNLREDTFKSLPIDKAEGYYLKTGDVLFARSGATVGKTFQFKNYNGKACFAGYLIKASVNETKLLSNYLYYFTKSPSYDSWKNNIFTQSTIQNISATKYDYLPLSVPEIKEQKQIVEYLDDKLDKILKIKENLQKQIEKLQDYRKSIIHECVTGKRRITEKDIL
ncbi:restriction endonuclease subunit S, partial [Candidatus Dependentiae bacterium]|nr:restriction endonuclease subunit S [Candidatus Dependentiae bacterium]